MDEKEIIVLYDLGALAIAYSDDIYFFFRQ